MKDNVFARTENQTLAIKLSLHPVIYHYLVVLLELGCEIEPLTMLHILSCGKTLALW